jgi:carbon monoxide dehydrogenase subunit G
MGKVNFQSQSVQLKAAPARVFSFLADLNNLQHLMPEQVINWQSTDSSCSFDIKGMAHINLEMAEVIQDKFIRIISGPDNPLDLEIKGFLEKSGESQTSAIIELTADLSPMLQLLASAPMQNLVNIMAEKLQGVSF